MKTLNGHKKKLRESWMFAGISDSAMEEISDKVSMKTFPPASIILGPEDTSHQMYIVLEGKVKAVDIDMEGNETILAIHGAKESFGEIALIDGKTFPAAIVTLEYSTLALITKQNFHSLMVSHPLITQNVMAMMCARLRELWSKVILINNNGAYEKVRGLLMQLAKEHGSETDDSAIVLDMKLTHQSLADMTGLTREYVTRIVADLKKSGAISIVTTDKGRRFSVLMI